MSTAAQAQGGIQPDGWSGACWAFVNAKFGQIMFGTYPIEERWRPILVGILLVALLVPMLMPKVPRKGLNAVLSARRLADRVLHPAFGGSFGLPMVETPRWGGLLITLVVAFVGIVVSLPLGIVLALGRRSKMPVVKTLCVIFIEFVRGVPLITVLFMASVMLPLFLPPGVTFDKLLRALIGVSLFSAAYMAEVVRGGLQAIPKGQYEGADSLGLGYWQKMYLVVLPQALKLVIPGIVNTFIGMFKDTSLVSIISMFDLLGIVKQNFADPNWATPVTANCWSSRGRARRISRRSTISSVSIGRSSCNTGCLCGASRRAISASRSIIRRRSWSSIFSGCRTRCCWRPSRWACPC